MFQFGGRGSGDCQFEYPRGVGVDCETNIIVCDSGNENIKVIEIKKLEWSKDSHQKFTAKFKKATFTLLVAWNRRRYQSWCRGEEKEEKTQNVFSSLLLEMIHLIIQFLATVRA